MNRAYPHGPDREHERRNYWDPFKAAGTLERAISPVLAGFDPTSLMYSVSVTKRYPRALRLAINSGMIAVVVDNSWNTIMWV